LGTYWRVLSFFHKQISSLGGGGELGGTGGGRGGRKVRKNQLNVLWGKWYSLSNNPRPLYQEGIPIKKKKQKKKKFNKTKDKTKNKNTIKHNLQENVISALGGPGIGMDARKGRKRNFALMQQGRGRKRGSSPKSVEWLMSGWK